MNLLYAAFLAAMFFVIGIDAVTFTEAAFSFQISADGF